MPDTIARLNDALEGRYVVERELGRGGMATVFLARDVKHGRHVAIKLPELSATIAGERFLREISIAAGLAHPHIVPLHDSGVADGLLYYVMPYLEGESLKELLDREGSLSVADAVRIAIEVAQGLTYAHEHGVIHRDVKPANILLVSGQAVVADFGVARAIDAASDVRLTRHGTSMGSPLYMSPEQSDGADVDGRSDVFSLGCVLYEMLTGTTPWSGPSLRAVVTRRVVDPPRPMRDLRASVPEELEGAVMRALEKEPDARFATAADFAAALEGVAVGAAPRPRRPGLASWRPMRVAAVATSVLLALALVLATSSDGMGFEERDWIVVADLQNHTGEDVFDRSLNTALTVAVAQSQYVNVFPRARVRETLTRMGRSDATVVNDSLAAEVAVREGLKAVLSFEISSLAGTYLVTTSVLAPESRAVVSTETARAEGHGEVLAAVDELARRLRSGLGESLATIRARSVPLPQATTPSLQALKRYADGSSAWGQGRWDEARTLWRQAVEADSMFAWAHASLGLAADWLEGAGSGGSHYAKALGLLDRVTERERLWIRSLIENGEASVETLRSFTRQYPDDRDAWYNLGNGLRGLGRSEEALEAYGRVLGLDARYAWAHVNRGMVLDEIGRPADAVQSFRAAFAADSSLRRQSIGDINRISGFALAETGDTTGARATFELLLDGTADERANGLRSLALLEMARGRNALAIGHLQEAINLSRTTGSRLSEFRNRLYLATAHAGVGDADAARQARVTATEVLMGLSGVSSWGGLTVQHLARAGDVARAHAVQTTLVDPFVGADSGPAERARADQARAELAMATGDAATAIRLLEGAYGLRRSRDGLEALARAYAGGGRLEEAEGAYEELLATPHLGDELGAYWLESHGRLARLYEEQGRADDARRWYRALLDRVGAGDEDLVVRRQAEEGLARLAGG